MPSSTRAHATSVAPWIASPSGALARHRRLPGSDREQSAPNRRSGAFSHRAATAVGRRRRTRFDLHNDAMTDVSSAFSVVPANEASWNDLQTLVGTRGAAAWCQCQRYKLRPREAFRKFPVEERATGCVSRPRGEAGSLSARVGSSTPGLRMPAGSSVRLAAPSAAAKTSGRWRSYQGRWSRPTAWWWVIVPPWASDRVGRGGLDLVPLRQLGAPAARRDDGEVRRRPVGVDVREAAGDHAAAADPRDRIAASRS